MSSEYQEQRRRLEEVRCIREPVWLRHVYIGLISYLGDSFDGPLSSEMRRPETLSADLGLRAVNR